MIHQLIFAAPKPGMSDHDFQRYWLDVHAVKYASKITQIKKYLIDTIKESKHASDIPFRGVAEIWIENEEQQLESLQSKAFLEGARRDEPNWAAFWLTLALDTDAHVIVQGPPLTPDPDWVKLIILNKRKPGMSLRQYREYSLQTHAEKVKQLPGLRRFLQCHARDGLYTLGESRFDGVWQLWFDNLNALESALDSDYFQQQVRPDYDNFLDTNNVFQQVAEEHWIIGPEKR